MNDPRRNSPTIIAKARREKFLKVLAKTGKVIEATRACGLTDSRTLYQAREEDADFAAAWETAILASADLLEEAAWDRAVHGTVKPILFKGEVVAEELQYSDTLLLAMLAARKKEYKKQLAADADVNVNVKVGVAVLPMVAADPGAWEKHASVVHDNQKQLPAFEEPGLVKDAEFEEVPSKAKPLAAEPGGARTLERG